MIWLTLTNLCQMTIWTTITVYFWFNDFSNVCQRPFSYYLSYHPHKHPSHHIPYIFLRIISSGPPLPHCHYSPISRHINSSLRWSTFVNKETEQFSKREHRITNSATNDSKWNKVQFQWHQCYDWTDQTLFQKIKHWTKVNTFVADFADRSFTTTACNVY